MLIWVGKVENNKKKKRKALLNVENMGSEINDKKVEAIMVMSMWMLVFLHLFLKTMLSTPLFFVYSFLTFICYRIRIDNVAAWRPSPCPSTI